MGIPISRMVMAITDTHTAALISTITTTMIFTIDITTIEMTAGEENREVPHHDLGERL